MKIANFLPLFLLVVFNCCQQKKITAPEKISQAQLDSINNQKAAGQEDLPNTVEKMGDVDANKTITKATDSTLEKSKGILPDQQFISRGFLIVTSPGAQMVDEQGNPVDNFLITREIYIEHPGKEKPHSITATTPEGSVYKGTASLMAKEGTDIGTMVTNNRRVFLKPKTNNQLWKIILEPIGFTKQSTQPHLYLDVKAQFGNTTFKTRMDVETQLAGQVLY